MSVSDEPLKLNEINDQCHRTDVTLGHGLALISSFAKAFAPRSLHYGG